jgi:methylated-DNA-protein-cysteine methyltransferase related protein
VAARVFNQYDAPMAAPESDFRAAVRRIVNAIPPGTVLSYGRVAVLAGRSGAPRAVVQALKGLTEVAWWRVARADGTLAPKVAREQARRLRQEGAQVVKNRVLRRERKRSTR